MRHISKILLALVSILSYNNTSQCMEGNTINDNSGAFSYEEEYKNLHPLLKGASVEALKVEDYNKCIDYLKDYPSLQYIIEKFFHDIYGIALSILMASHIMDFYYPDSSMNYHNRINNNIPECTMNDFLNIWRENHNSFCKNVNTGLYGIIEFIFKEDQNLAKGGALIPDKYSAKISIKQCNIKNVIDIFNDVHKKLNEELNKGLNKELNKKYQPISIEKLLENKNDKNNIKIREYFYYLANNFVQFINEICMCINSKCKGNTNFIGKKN